MACNAAFPVGQNKAGELLWRTCGRESGHEPPHAPGPPCRGCGKWLLPENRTMADGCPCNSARGINHALVLRDVCACAECDPEQTGSSRYLQRPTPPPPNTERG